MTENETDIVGISFGQGVKKSFGLKYNIRKSYLGSHSTSGTSPEGAGVICVINSQSDFHKKIIPSQIKIVREDLDYFLFMINLFQIIHQHGISKTVVGGRAGKGLYIRQQVFDMSKTFPELCHKGIHREQRQGRQVQILWRRL